MAYFDFLWLPRVLDKLAERGIPPEDVEDVIKFPETSGVSRSSGRPIAWGHTSDGRCILAVFDKLDEITVQPITAFEVPEPGE